MPQSCFTLQTYKKFTYQATIKKKLLLCICDISATFIFDSIMERMIFFQTTSPAGPPCGSCAANSYFCSKK